MGTQFLNPEELVKRFNNAVSVQTLANWRNLKKGPAYLKIGGRVMYKLEDVENWEKQQTIKPTN